MHYSKPEIIEENGRFVIALGDLRFCGGENRASAEAQLSLYLQFHEEMLDMGDDDGITLQDRIDADALRTAFDQDCVARETLGLAFQVQLRCLALGLC